MNPVTEILNEKLADIKKNELELWNQWKKSGHKPDDFRPLLNSFRPLLNRTVRQYSRSSAIPVEAIEAEVHTNFLNACKTYTPTHGAQLSTWVHTHLQKTGRYVNEYSNIGKIPEPRIALINRFTTARDELHEHHDRPPTHDEIVKRMNEMAPDKKKVNTKEIKNLEIELSRRDLSESGFEDSPVAFQTPKELEAVRLLMWSNKLTDEERQVFNHVFGVHEDQILVSGKMKKPGDIARSTGFSNSKISRIRNSIAKKIQMAADLV